MKIAVVGGGSTYTPELIDGLVNIEKELNITEVVLLDIKKGEEKLNILTDFAKRLLKNHKSEIRLSSTLNSREAFENADIVINQFRAGGLESRIKDEKIPLKYNLIGQETTGIGGMANGIRALEIIKKYTKEIKEVSNNAWIINFANPSGMLTEYLINHLEYKRAIGVCNVPIEFIVHLQKIFNCKKEDLFMKYYGLNHLTWIEKIMVNGEDRSDELWDNFSVNMKNIPDIDYKENFLPSIKMLMNSYIKYFYNTKEMLQSEKDDLEKEGCRGEQIVDIEKTLLEKYAEPDRMETPEELTWRGGFMYSTVATELIRDLYRGDESIHIVNTRNNGTIDDMPDDYIMEIPVKITKNGPKSIKLGSSNPMNAGLIHTIKNYERLTIKGFITGEEKYIKQAMLIHPLGPDEMELDEVWEDIKEQNREYFPDFV